MQGYTFYLSHHNETEHISRITPSCTAIMVSLSRDLSFRYGINNSDIALEIHQGHFLRVLGGESSMEFSEIFPVAQPCARASNDRFVPRRPPFLTLSAMCRVTLSRIKLVVVVSNVLPASSIQGRFE